MAADRFMLEGGGLTRKGSSIDGGFRWMMLLRMLLLLLLMNDADDIVVEDNEQLLQTLE